MFSDAQMLYLSEVLGVSVQSYRLPPGPATQTVVSGAVLTKPLQDDEVGLLNRILAAVGADSWPRLVSQDAALGVRPQTSFEIPQLLFFGSDEIGRHEVQGTTWIALPALGRMLGTGVEVAHLKKQVWEELKRLKA